MAMAMLMAIIITSVCSFICLLWLIFTTAMRMRVMGNVAITTNVLTKANMLPSILNMIMDDFFGTKLIIIFITCCIAMAI